MKILHIALALVIAVSLVITFAVPVEAATLYEYLITDGTAFDEIHGTHWDAQTFTPSIAHTITSVKLLLFKTGNPGTITVSIRATSGGSPTGGDLCSGTTNGNTLPTSSPYEWREITLGAGTLLDADTKYAIVVRALGGDWDNNVRWSYADHEAPGDYYEAGDFCISHTTSGSSWIYYAGMDALFEEWGEPVIEAPTVTTQAVSSIEETIAIGNGNITNTGGENCDKRGIVYGTSSQGDPGNVAPGASGYDSYEEEAGSFGTGAFTRGLTGLTPGQLYYVRAYAHNSEGYSYGAEVSFTTKPDPPTNLHDTGRTTTSITMEWDAPALGSVTGYYLRYKVGSYPTSYTDGSEGYTGANTSHEVSGLATGQTYYFKVWSYKTGSPNAGGCCDDPGASAEDTAYTYGPPEVTTNAANTITSSSAKLHGNITNVCGQNVDLRGFDWGLTDSYGSSWTEGVLGEYDYGTGAFEHIISTLPPNTLFHFRAKAHNSYGWSYGDDLTFTTDVAVPTATTNEATNITCFTAKLHGYLNDDGGESCEIRFEYDTDSGAPYTYNTEWANSYEGGQSFNETIESLTADTPYYFRVQVKNTAGTFSGSEKNFTTLLHVTDPTNLIATAVSNTEVSLKWVKGTGAARSKVQRKIGSYPTSYSDGDTAYFGTGATYTDSNLSPGTTYYYRVWCEDSGTYSDSPSEDFETTPAGATEYVGPTGPLEPTSWFQVPDPTNLSGLPGYALVNNLADTYGMPHGSMWMIILMVCVIGASTTTLLLTKSLLLALATAGVLIGVGAVVELLPMWMLFVEIVIAGTMAYTWKKA